MCFRKRSANVEIRCLEERVQVSHLRPFKLSHPMDDSANHKKLEFCKKDADKAVSDKVFLVRLSYSNLCVFLHSYCGLFSL